MMYERMAAMTQVINGPRFDQPIINVSYPEESASNRISELAEPDAMISITTGNTSRKVPNKSIGLMISEEAMATTTLDLVNINMTAQARGERYRMVQEQLGAILNGDSRLRRSRPERLHREESRPVDCRCRRDHSHCLDQVPAP